MNRECCQKFKNTYLLGEQINFCPKCGNSFIELPNEKKFPILNQKETYHIRTEKVSSFDDEFREYVRENILPSCKIAEGIYKYNGELLSGHDEGMRITQIIHRCDWNYITGYVRQK